MRGRDHAGQGTLESRSGNDQRDGIPCVGFYAQVFKIPVIARDHQLEGIPFQGGDHPFDRGIEAAIELKKWDRYAARAKIRMRRLVKTHDASWFNGSTSSIPPSNLDHVFASDHLKFRVFRRPADGGDAEVAVRGWVDQPTPAKKDDWIAKYSDHSLLYFEIHD